MQLKAPQNSSLFQFLQLMQLAGKENDPRALKALKLIQMDEGYYKSAFVQGVIKSLTDEISKNAVNGETPNAFRHEICSEVHGPLEIGQVVYSFDSVPQNSPIFGVYPIELCVPTLISGGTGSGKTNVLYVLASEINRFNRTYQLKDDNRIGMFFFQTMKLDEDYLYNINDEIIFLDSDTLKINPLWHKGYNKESVFQHFIKLGGEIFFWREVSANQSSTILEKKDRENNGQPFSVYEFYEGIKKLPKTRHEGVLENRLAGLLSNKSGKIFDCIKGIPFEKIAHDFVIINLTDLDFYSQQFIAIYIYQYLTEYFKTQNRNRLNTVLVYDEGDTTFSRHAEQVMIGYPTASTLFTTSRSSGIGAVVITHQPHKVITSLRSEAYTKIIFNLSDAEDARYMAQACSLSKEEQEMISKLPNYHAIVSTRRISRPFIIRTFNKADELRKKPIEIKDKTREKIAELQSQVIPRQNKTEISIETTKENHKENTLADFGLLEIKILESIAADPFLTTLERYEKLGLTSKSKANDAMKNLQKRGFIKEVKVKVKKGRGGQAYLQELTKAGLDRLSIKHQSYRLKGSLAHSYYATRVSLFFERLGFETRFEYKACDVTVKKDNELIGVEISLSLQNLKSNCDRNAANGFTKTILVFDSKDAMEKVNIQPSENIELKLIDDFFGE